MPPKKRKITATSSTSRENASEKSSSESEFSESEFIEPDKHNRTAQEALTAFMAHMSGVPSERQSYYGFFHVPTIGTHTSKPQYGQGLLFKCRR